MIILVSRLVKYKQSENKTSVCSCLLCSKREPHAVQKNNKKATKILEGTPNKKKRQGVNNSVNSVQTHTQQWRVCGQH